MDSDFDNVTWSTESDSQHDRSESRERNTIPDVNGNRHSNGPPEPRPRADPVDLSGVGLGQLECQVGSPLKENDGTKDAYVSYLITTNVSLLCLTLTTTIVPELIELDRLQIIPKTHLERPPPLHRLRISFQKPLKRLSSMRRPTVTGQAKDGVRKRGPLWARLHTSPSSFFIPLPKTLNSTSHPPSQLSFRRVPRESGLERPHAAPSSP